MILRPKQKEIVHLHTFTIYFTSLIFFLFPFQENTWMCDNTYLLTYSYWTVHKEMYVSFIKKQHTYIKDHIRTLMIK